MERLDEEMPHILRAQGVPLEDILTQVFVIHEQLQEYTVEYGSVSLHA